MSWRLDREPCAHFSPRDRITGEGPAATADKAKALAEADYAKQPRP
jgi:hypothetical protein